MMNGPKKVALRGNISQLLTGLGGTPDEVASALSREGVRGIPRDVKECAIARYVNAIISADKRVGRIVVGTTGLSLRGPHWWSSSTVMEMPVAIQQFVRAFDRDRYPFLVSAEGPLPEFEGFVSDSVCGGVDPESLA
jgi:hypothetical protein